MVDGEGRDVEDWISEGEATTNEELS